MITIENIGGTSVVRQVKRAFTADTIAAMTKKSAIQRTIGNTCLTALNGGCLAYQASAGRAGLGILAGVCTVLAGLLTGGSIKDFMQAVKTKKQTSQALKDIVSKKDYMDVMNRYLRINGKKEITSEQLIEAFNKVN